MGRKIWSIVVVAVVSAAALGTLTAGPVSSSAFPGANGKIAFTSGPANRDIFVIEPDGTDLRQLTTDPGEDRDPNWSSDGRRIAFNREDDIWVMNADGTNQRRLTNDGRSTEPSWSPDGEEIAFTRLVGTTYEIFVMDADGTNQRQLSSAGVDDVSPSWSPDGEHIVFTEFVGFANNEIFVMDADGTNPRNLTNSPEGDFAASWSPDGEQITFTRTLGINNEIFVMGADGTNQRNLTNDPDNDIGSAWSPDGERIAFSHGLAGNDDIFVMDADGTNRRQVTNGPDDDGGANWQPRSVEGDVTVTKWVNGTPAAGTTFQVKVDCDGEQDDKVLTFGETGGTQGFERETFGPLECEVTETQTGGATTVEITCTADKNAECDKPDAFTLFDDPSDDGSNVEINVVNTFPIAVEPNFTG